MVYFVSGWQEEELLQIALAKLFAETTNSAEREKLGKMLLQFPSNHIFIQLLFYVGFFALADLDNAFNISVDGFYEHFLNFHCLFSLIHKFESSVIIIIFDFAKEY